LAVLGLWTLAACGPEVGVAAPSPSASATGGPVTTAPATTAPVTTAATTSPPAVATASPSATTVAPRSFTVVGSGDILLHGLLWTQGANDAHALGQSGYDFVPLLASVIPVVSKADLAICHMETPYGPANGPFTDYPLFTVPPQVATAIAAVGYDTCSTASNHSIDAGEVGVDRTLDALDAAGVKHAGTARNPAEAASINMLDVKGIPVAQLSYSFGFNGLIRPAGKEWLANLLDPDRILADAHRAKLAGAQVVIVSIHWGTEYSHFPNPQQITVAHRLLASPDIDLILGHHVHVVQPVQRVGDKWVAYGMGNEVAYQNQADDTRDGIIPRFTFTETRPGQFRVTKAEVIPIHMWLDTKPTRLLNVPATLADPKASAVVKASCRASRLRTVSVLNTMGAFDAGLTVVGGTTG
jgi:poly-gamma-glutamate capsule biosynthesis protein CapA/YwtB (metallophosphatase superfamily)